MSSEAKVESVFELSLPAVTSRQLEILKRFGIEYAVTENATERRLKEQIKALVEQKEAFDSSCLKTEVGIDLRWTCLVTGHIEGWILSANASSSEVIGKKLVLTFFFDNDSGLEVQLGPKYKLERPWKEPIEISGKQISIPPGARARVTITTPR